MEVLCLVKKDLRSSIDTLDLNLLLFLILGNYCIVSVIGYKINENYGTKIIRREGIFDLIANIIYPFVYLDSSSVLRDKNLKVEMLTRNFLNKSPHRIKQIFHKMQTASLNDNSYYLKLLELQAKGQISKIITMEVFNPYCEANNENIIKLFGTVQSKMLYSKDSNERNLLDHVTLWNETVEFTTFNKAALAIANAKCIVADSTFFQIAIGKTLTEYIITGCPVFITFSDINSTANIEGKYTICELSPKELIMRLSSDY